MWLVGRAAAGSKTIEECVIVVSSRLSGDVIFDKILFYSVMREEKCNKHFSR